MNVVSWIVTCCLFFLGPISLNANPILPTAVQESSLLYKSWAIYSQWGEEGILDEILMRLNIKNGFFVEFGGWDACHLSNTRFLADRGWAGMFIEADEKLHHEAVKNCAHLSKVQCLCEFVTDKPTSKGKTLDQIAAEYFPQQEIDVLSIDIDGADYLILEKLKCRPKVILIEGGISWHPLVTKRMPDLIAKNQLNQPLYVIFKIASKAGYTPVCFTINSFLIRNDLIEPFKCIKNDAVTLWFDSWYYYLEKFPIISSYIREVRATDPWILQYDNYQLP